MSTPRHSSGNSIARNSPLGKTQGLISSTQYIRQNGKCFSRTVGGNGDVCVEGVVVDGTGVPVPDLVRAAGDHGRDFGLQKEGRVVGMRCRRARDAVGEWFVCHSGFGSGASCSAGMSTPPARRRASAKFLEFPPEVRTEILPKAIIEDSLMLPTAEISMTPHSFV